MLVSVELLATLISVVILIIGFIISRNKEAESRGRLLQRIDSLETTLKEMRERVRVSDDKISCHDIDLIKIEGDIQSLRDSLERIEKKLDIVIGAKI
jgi:hypothetical protein